MQAIETVVRRCVLSERGHSRIIEFDCLRCERLTTPTERELFAAIIIITRSGIELREAAMCLMALEIEFHCKVMNPKVENEKVMKAPKLAIKA
jgi:hypothetical protein